MTTDRAEAECVLIEDLRSERQGVQRWRLPLDQEVVDPWSYWAKRGLGTIQLSPVEYRILSFLASRPNRAFTYHRIAQAASTATLTVTSEMLGRYIHSLRGQLGFFGDYIQAVPYIGYRFKA